MPSRLQIINDELIGLGLNAFSEPDDGSPEWLACSAAYDATLEHLLDEHNWGFAKAIVEVEDRTDPDDPAWQDAYDKPDGCLHVVRVMDTGGTRIKELKILGDQILVNSDAGILVECIMEPDPGLWPGLFIKALRHGIRAGVYRAIPKDTRAADAEEKKVEFYLAKARPRGDLEEPGRVKFTSTLATSRSRRRG